MTELGQTVRRLFRAPGFSIASVLTLAIGIGATVAIFAVVNGILLKPLPFSESDRLVSLTHRIPEQGLENLPASSAIYFTYKDHNRTFESVALWQADTASVTAPGEPEEVPAMLATFEFLPTLGVAPALGRAFTEADDQADSVPTVMLSHAYWQRRFGGAESVLGQDLVVDGSPHRIIGVLPSDFRFLRRPAEILLPMRPVRALSFVGPLGENGIARLRPGVTLEEANADVARMLPIMSETFPAVPGMDIQAVRNLRMQPALRPLKETFVGDLDDVLLVLTGTIAMLLVVACANVANLHLVRTEGRARELAIQSALGASRGRLAGALMRESLVLGLVGGVLGLASAAVALPILLAFAADELPRVLAVTIDPTVIGFAIAVSLLSGLAFGAIPALRYAGPRLARVLSGSGRSHSASRERYRVQHALIAAQVAFALILVVASGLMVRTFVALTNVDPGFSAPAEVQTVTVSLPQASVPEFPRAVRMFHAMQDALGAVAGVESVGFASRAPLGDEGPSAGFFVENSALPDSVAPPQSEFRYTSPNFFETLGTPLLAGRTFDWSDHHDARPVVIVSAGFARREWGGAENAVGKRLRLTPADPWREVVGVVADIHHERLDRPAPDTVYLTLGELLAQYMSRTVTFVIRSERVGTSGFLQDIQGAIWSVDSSLPLANVGTLEDLEARAAQRTALTLVLLAITGGMTLLLGLVGIYAVIGYLLAQRTREIGIRVALGARTGAVRRMLVLRIALPVMAGIAVGLLGAAASSRLIESLLYGVTALDPSTYALAALLLVTAAAVAAYLPARRAARVDPMSALRAE